MCKITYYSGFSETDNTDFLQGHNANIATLPAIPNSADSRAMLPYSHKAPICAF